MPVTICECGCGRRRFNRRIGDSHYAIFLDTCIGTVRRETTVHEVARPGLYSKDTHWVNSIHDDWFPTRGEAIDMLLFHAHIHGGPP